MSTVRSRIGAVVMLVLIAAAVTFVIVAAQDDEDTTPVNPQLPTAPVAVVDVVSTVELDLDVSRSSVPSGDIELTYRAEEGTHALVITGVPGFRLESSGETVTGSVRLAPGTYLLHCEISGHGDAGERATLEVG
jgi:hypothetical protein